MNNIEDSETSFAQMLFDRGYISGPKVCSSGNTKFSIQNDKYSKISKCVFRCKNQKCKFRHSIRINSFYALFPKTKLRLVSEIINNFLEGKNASKCYDNLKYELKVSISLVTVQTIYAEIRNVITKYLNISYQSEPFAEKNEHKICSIDESLFVTDQTNNQIWVIGAIDNLTKDFRIDIAFRRNQNVLKTFITQYIEEDNKLITDGWSGYSFIDEMIGYQRELHIHGSSDFRYGVNSTSHIESLWSQLKATIKNIYYIIPHQNFIYYLREAEWRIKNKAKTIEEKISEFFKCWSVINEMEDYVFMNNEYLNQLDA